MLLLKQFVQILEFGQAVVVLAGIDSRPTARLDLLFELPHAVGFLVESVLHSTKILSIDWLVFPLFNWSVVLLLLFNSRSECLSNTLGNIQALEFGHTRYFLLPGRVAVRRMLLLGSLQVLLESSSYKLLFFGRLWLLCGWRLNNFLSSFVFFLLDLLQLPFCQYLCFPPDLLIQQSISLLLLLLPFFFQTYLRLLLLPQLLEILVPLLLTLLLLSLGLLHKIGGLLLSWLWYTWNSLLLLLLLDIGHKFLAVGLLPKPP